VPLKVVTVNTMYIRDKQVKTNWSARNGRCFGVVYFIEDSNIEEFESKNKWTDGCNVSIDYSVLNYNVSCSLDTSVEQETVQSERNIRICLPQE
jgi:hypothetical protein